MKKITLWLAVVGVFALAGSAFAQTVPNSSPVITGDVDSQLGDLTVQVQDLAYTPIITSADEGQALIILQSITRALAGLANELNNNAAVSLATPSSGSNSGIYASADVAVAQ